MRLINADELEKTLETAINMQTQIAVAFGIEGEEYVKAEIKAYSDILQGIKETPSVTPNTPKPQECVGVEEALRTLDAINSSGRLDYGDYCDLHDAISSIEQLEPCDDAISRQAAIDVIEAGRLTKLIDAETAVNGLKALPPAQPEQRWIPFVLRPATDEEKEENPGLDYYLEGKLPEDEQKILITVRLPGHEEVYVDEFYTDADGSYLDGQYEIGTEAVAWMPLPAPYEEEKKK